jgi:entry exclusion lipoprotein TrbK
MKPNSIHAARASLACLMLALLGCSSDAGSVSIPEANAENCKQENIRKISDKAAREAFASRCFRRGTFEPSPNKTW